MQICNVDKPKVYLAAFDAVYYRIVMVCPGQKYHSGRIDLEGSPALRGRYMASV